MRAPISALMKYEILFNHGGIHLDFKVEGVKKLDPFLKYEIFFDDCDLTYSYKEIGWVGNGAAGSISNNYHLHFILTKFISQDTLNLDSTNFEKIVGGYVVRRSFTEEELYKNVGFGLQLLMPRPSQENIYDIKCAYQEKLS